MEDDLLVAGVLLTDVLERVAQCLDRRLDRRLHVTPLELQTVDLTLDVLEPRLGLLEQQLRAPFGVTNEALRFVLPAGLDVVGKALRRDQRRLETALVFTVLVEQLFQTLVFATEPVRLA